VSIISRIGNSLRELVGPPRQPYMPQTSPTNSIKLNDMKYMITDAMTASTNFFGSNQSLHGGTSREGYTSLPYDVPVVRFKVQKTALEEDEDVQLAMNQISSQIAGAEHYWQSTFDSASEYMSKFTKQIDFDWLDVIAIKECIWFGNSLWKPRMGISEIRNKDDLFHIPITSFTKIWWDKDRIPYKYEFIGAEYQGYHNPNDIIHLSWNPINGSLIGNGFAVPIVVQRVYNVQTPTGIDERRSPSLMDSKLETRNNMLQSQKRYLTRNVYTVVDGEEEDVAFLRADLGTLEPMEDVVSGNKIEVQELGSAQRNFDPTLFSDLVQGPIFKALNNFRGKEAGESQHSFANAKTSAILDEIGMASFPLSLARQFNDQLFKPWYEANPLYTPEYDAYLSLPWDEAEFDLNFGRQEKKSIELEDTMKALEIGISSGAVNDPIEIREILGDILPLKKEYTDMMTQQYHDTSVMPQDFQLPNQLDMSDELMVNTDGMQFTNVIQEKEKELELEEQELKIRETQLKNELRHSIHTTLKKLNGEK